MSDDLLTEQYDDDQEAELGRRRNWANGWIVRRRREVEVGDTPSFLSIPSFEEVPLFAALIGVIVIGLGFWAVRNRRRRKIEVVYERANDD
ncbi:MAG: hypothetical protein AB7J35_12050 [Dehalococcoidia bacterium]